MWTSSTDSGLGAAALMSLLSGECERRGKKYKNRDINVHSYQFLGPLPQFPPHCVVSLWRKQQRDEEAHVDTNRSDASVRRQAFLHEMSCCFPPPHRDA